MSGIMLPFIPRRVRKALERSIRHWTPDANYDQCALVYYCPRCLASDVVFCTKPETDSEADAIACELYRDVSRWMLCGHNKRGYGAYYVFVDIGRNIHSAFDAENSRDGNT